eukprot:647917-Pleurochrysis_carterae.AAC.1
MMKLSRSNFPPLLKSSLSRSLSGLDETKRERPSERKRDCGGRRGGGNGKGERGGKGERERRREEGRGGKEGGMKGRCRRRAR